MSAQTEDGVSGTNGTYGSVVFPGAATGAARAKLTDKTAVLENDVLRCEWQLCDGRPVFASFENRLTGERADAGDHASPAVMLDAAPAAEPVELSLGDMETVSPIRLEGLTAEPGATRLAERFQGKRLVAEFAHEATGLRVEWSAALRDEANTVRVGVRVTQTPMSAVREALLLGLRADGAAVIGEVSGSPVATDSLFFGVEHPRSQNSAESIVRCALPLPGFLRGAAEFVVSAVLGVAPAGQLRRSFLYYLEREGPQPYRPYVHYNNGYELGCAYWRKHRGEGAEAACEFRHEEQLLFIRCIRAIGEELAEKRGVTLDGAVHDYMWDDEDRLWRFHEGYSEGFGPAGEAAAKYGAGIGVWFSPWGGYPGRKARVAAGQQQGFQTSANGLTLTCPKYFARFLSACVGMVRDEHVNYFKFDGFGAGNDKGGPGEYASDVDALLTVIEELRRLNPTLVINPSTGSWPSPFWLLWADVIWRQARDSGVGGKGSARQRWITYRDAAVYEKIVKSAPLYPLNALMLHGVFINSSPFSGSPLDPDADAEKVVFEEVRDEVRTFFGAGTSLQELYVDPDMMTPETWDALAEAAKWGRQNAAVLADTHWLGGDPAVLEPYGWASWTTRKGIVVLRNPDEETHSFELDIGEAFELPAEAPAMYVLADTWRTRPEFDGKSVEAGAAVRVELSPFEVLVLEAVPE